MLHFEKKSEKHGSVSSFLFAFVNVGTENDNKDRSDVSMRSESMTERISFGKHLPAVTQF